MPRYAGANGTSNGTQARPFTLLTGAGSFDAATLPDNNTNDVVFIKQGSYTCGLTLVNTQRHHRRRVVVRPADDRAASRRSPAAACRRSPAPIRHCRSAARRTASPWRQDNTIRGVTISPTARRRHGVSGATFGTLTIRRRTISGAGRALNLTTSGTLAVTLDGLVSSGSTTQRHHAVGSRRHTDREQRRRRHGHSGATGAAVSVAGGTVAMTYNGDITQANNAALLSVTGGHATGTLTFQTGTLSATGGTGLQFDNADGTYNFNGTTHVQRRRCRHRHHQRLDRRPRSTLRHGPRRSPIRAAPRSPSSASNVNVTQASGSIATNTAEFAVGIGDHDPGTVDAPRPATNHLSASARRRAGRATTTRRHDQLHSRSTSLQSRPSGSTAVNARRLSNAGGTINFNAQR